LTESVHNTFRRSKSFKIVCSIPYDLEDLNCHSIFIDMVERNDDFEASEFAGARDSCHVWFHGGREDEKKKILDYSYVLREKKAHNEESGGKEAEEWNLWARRFPQWPRDKFLKIVEMWDMARITQDLDVGIFQTVYES